MPNREPASEAARTAIRRVRVMSTGRWHAPIGLPMGERRGARLVVVGAATGGAGKSVVATNLAAAIAALGRQVVLADLDLATPRQHRLLGLRPPTETLDAWLEKKRDRADFDPDIAPVASGIRNLRVVPAAAVAMTPAGGAEPRAPGLDLAARRALVAELYDLDCDVVVVDLGDGNRHDLFDLFASRALRLVVTAPDLGALEATYAFLADATRRAGRRYGAGAAAALKRFQGALVGNRTETPEQLETVHGFSRLVAAQLGIPIPVLASFQPSDRIAQSAFAGQPLVARRGLDANVRAFHQMAELVLGEGDLAGTTAATPSECALDVVDAASDADASAGPRSDSVLAASAESLTPAALARHVRKHPRIPVDWAATLEHPNGALAVRVRDVSESGAALETAVPLRVGDVGVLHFDQLAGRPALAVTVSNVVPEQRRVGVHFDTDGHGSGHSASNRAAASIARLARARLRP